MHLHGCPGRAKWRPVQQAQTQIDCRAIERIDRCVDGHVHGLVDIELPGLRNQAYCQCVIDAPVPLIERIRQGRAGRHALQSHVKQFGLIGRKTNFDIAQGLAPRQLREGHHAKHVGATQGAHTGMATVALDDASESLPRRVFHHLRKQRLSNVHASPQVVSTRKYRKCVI